jgi:hypothetical protein
MTTPQHPSDIARQLEGLSVIELSNAPWSDESLVAVVQDHSAPLIARLYACDILLRRHQAKYLSLLGRETVAAIYVSAFADRVTVDLNPWAFLNLDEVGPLGQSLAACGESAVAKLVPLLDIDRAAGVYNGSEEAKEGNADRARVCDFAAFFIAKIKQLPYRFHRDDFSLRDAENDRVKKVQ